MQPRDKSTASDPARRLDVVPFKFPAEKRLLLRKRLEQAIRKSAPPDAYERFLLALEGLITLFRCARHDPAIHGLAETRAYLRELHHALEKFLSKLDPDKLRFVSLMFEGELSSELRALANALEPASALAQKYVKERLSAPIFSKGDLLVGTLALLKEGLYGLAQSLEAASHTPRGGQPDILKHNFLHQIVRDYRAVFGDLPSSTKKGPFEDVLLDALAEVGFSQSHANDHLREALRAARTVDPQ